MIVDVFDIGIYQPINQRILFKLAIEDDERSPKFSYIMDDKKRPAVWCVEHQQPLIMNDLDLDYPRYFGGMPLPKPTIGKQVGSLMYWPLIVGEQVIGVLTVQSYQKNAYNQQ